MAASHADVIVVGAGFAGLTAACAFAQRGWSVRVHERADQLRPTGAGIYVYENGLRVLEAAPNLPLAKVLGREKYILHVASLDRTAIPVVTPDEFRKAIDDLAATAEAELHERTARGRGCRGLGTRCAPEDQQAAHGAAEVSLQRPVEKHGRRHAARPAIWNEAAPRSSVRDLTPARREWLPPGQSLEQSPARAFRLHRPSEHPF